MEEIIIKKLQVCRICNGKELTDYKNYYINNYVIDSRLVKKDDCFIAIKGDNNNGNFYVEAALEKGASVCIVDEIPNETIIKKYNDRQIILVKNSIKALQDLAVYKRSLYNIPVVAVTGSVGKTSTKDIIASALGEKYKVLKTEGNLNNHIGLPLTLLKLKDHTAIVVEMGMNHFGEIRTLTNIAKPTVAVITNIGTSHIGNLGSRENILKAKLEILEGLVQDGTVIINNDNDLLHDWAQSVDNYKVVTFGIENKSDFIAEKISEKQDESNYKINIKNNEYNINVPVIGRHFVYNSLCAMAVGMVLDMKPNEIISGISKFKLSAKRMDFKRIKNNITILADYYNASYDSMKSALEVVKNYNALRKIAVLGDMLELGEYSQELHEKVGEEVAKNDIDILITVGSLSRCIAKKAKDLGLKNTYECDNNQEAIKVLKNIIKDKDLILLKASNGMKFGEILDEICNS